MFRNAVSVPSSTGDEVIQNAVSVPSSTGDEVIQNAVSVPSSTGDEVIRLHHLLKMEPIQRSETLAFNNNKMPGEYPEKFLSSGQKCFIFVQRGAGSDGSSHTCPPKAPPSPTRPSLSCLNNVPS
jgi:hypothetical protein